MAQSTANFPTGGHGKILSEKNLYLRHSHINHVADMLIKFRLKPLALLKCKSIKFFCTRRVTSTKVAKITTLTTFCLTCISDQIHHSTESTSMPALLYSFQLKLFYKISNNTILMVVLHSCG
ncbi:hypothetical protein NP493_802g03045 [Ridgeia piscesae]|uniref:Uncharacterized protein n=1 Tax=Ridgeia piscesae TaxID=27915 RepID=A0AAD9KN55_RIDPI|nr:hypothetical protein NP493_802g03045 [Ridgeia piscesae]